MKRRYYDDRLLIVKEGELMPEVGRRYTAKDYFSEDTEIFTVRKILSVDRNNKGDYLVTVEIE